MARMNPLDRHNERISAEGTAGKIMGSHEHQNLRKNIQDQSQKRLWWALVINLVFLVIEVIGGLITNSLALLADAGHMVTDVAALGLALFVAYLARRPATGHRTYGLLRAEVLGAFVNGATLIPIVGLVFWESWQRFGQPEDIDGRLMLAIAAAGLLANIGSSLILAKRAHEDINLEGAFLHMVADALGSLGAVIAGLVIWLTDWYPIDLIASVVIGLLILWSSLGLLKRTIHILLEATPRDIDFMEVKAAMEQMEHIAEVHDLHIWTITSGMPVLSAHVTITGSCSDTSHWEECLQEARRLLSEKFGITHSTIQVETSNGTCKNNCKI